MSIVSKSDHDIEKLEDFEQTIEHCDSMMDVLVRHKVDISEFDTSPVSLTQGSKVKASIGVNTTVEASTKQSKTIPQRKSNTHKHNKKSKPQKRLPKVVNRRRRRRQTNSDSSSEENESCSSDSDSDTGSATSEENLSVLNETLGEDELEMLDSLSDSSSSCDESNPPVKGKSVEQSPPQQSSQKSSHPSHTSSPSAKQQKGSKRQIVLAASFNLAPSPHSEKKLESPLSSQVSAETGAKLNQELASTPEDLKVSSDMSKETGQSGFLGVRKPRAATSISTHPNTATGSDAPSLNELIEETKYESLLHTVCCLATEESSLLSLRVFMEWLQSYPIVVAACSQVRRVDCCRFVEQ